MKIFSASVWMLSANFLVMFGRVSILIKALLQIPKFQIGKTGAENKLESRLRGSAGTKRIEVKAVGRVMRELDRKEGNYGADVQPDSYTHLTLATIDSG
mgnify:CR=1 FL=1